MYAANKLWQEALDAYNAIIKAKAVPQAARYWAWELVGPQHAALLPPLWPPGGHGWLPARFLACSQNKTPILPLFPNSLRINVGNVYFEQGHYPPAIKAYRMALDALPPSASRPRARLLRNIGLAFVRMGQYADAASAYSTALAAEHEHIVSGAGGAAHATTPGFLCC